MDMHKGVPDSDVEHALSVIRPSNPPTFCLELPDLLLRILPRSRRVLVRRHPPGFRASQRVLIGTPGTKKLIGFAYRLYCAGCIADGCQRDRACLVNAALSTGQTAS